MSKNTTSAPVFTVAAFSAFRSTTQLRPAWSVKFIPASENFCGKDVGAILVATAHVSITLNEGEDVTKAVIKVKESKWVNQPSSRPIWEYVATDLAEVNSILLNLHVACVHTAPRE